GTALQVLCTVVALVHSAADAARRVDLPLRFWWSSAALLSAPVGVRDTSARVGAGFASILCRRTGERAYRWRVSSAWCAWRGRRMTRVFGARVVTPPARSRGPGS